MRAQRASVRAFKAEAKLTIPAAMASAASESSSDSESQMVESTSEPESSSEAECSLRSLLMAGRSSAEEDEVEA